VDTSKKNNKENTMTKFNNNSVVILSAVRTAIGGFGGSLKNFTPAQLGTIFHQSKLVHVW